MIALSSLLMLCTAPLFVNGGPMQQGSSLAYPHINETRLSLTVDGLPVDLGIRANGRSFIKPQFQSHWPEDAPPIVNRQTIKNWLGWKNIDYIFSFGDSYTSTNFALTGPQPSANNSLGNPPYPGATSSNGPNYIDFLTNKYNQSYIQTYNLAYGGATVNPFLVPTAFGAAVKTFLSQVTQEFLPQYVNNANVAWTSTNTLFTIFFGINDCILSYREGNDSLNLAIIKSYEGLVNELYTAGARNFLFLNVPAVDRSPSQLIQSTADQKGLANYIGTFNFRLGALVYNLVRRHPDVTSFSFDTNFFFTAILDNSTEFPETANYLNTTGYCPSYMEYVFSSYFNNSDIVVTSELQAALTSVNGSPTLSYFYPPCGMPLNQYLWLNDLHPTYPLHEFMASQIVRLLDGQ